MKKTGFNNDVLLETFSDFSINDNDLKNTIGGKESTNGVSYDPDGCTARWMDLDGGGYSHMEDHVTCE